MKVNTMRNIDLYLGKFICLALTVCSKINSLFFKLEKTDNPKKILFIKMSEMGSLVIMQPAIKKIKKRYH